MSVTPAGMFSVPMQALQDLLTGLEEFQTWCGAADEAAAATRIYWWQLDEPVQGGDSDDDWRTAREALRPLALIGPGDVTTATEEAVTDYWSKTADMELIFEEMAQNDSGVQTGGNPVTTKDALTHLMNGVGAVMTALEAAVSGGGELDAIGWTMATPPGRMDPDAVTAGQLDITSVSFQLQRRDM